MAGFVKLTDTLPNLNKSFILRIRRETSIRNLISNFILQSRSLVRRAYLLCEKQTADYAYTGRREC